MNNQTPVFSLRLIDLLMMTDQLDIPASAHKTGQLTVLGKIAQFALHKDDFVIAKRINISGNALPGHHNKPFNFVALRKWLLAVHKATKTSAFSSMNVDIDFYTPSHEMSQFAVYARGVTIEPLTHWHMHGRTTDNPIDLFAQVDLDSETPYSVVVPLHEIIPYVRFNPNISRETDLRIHTAQGNELWSGFTVDGLIGSYRRKTA